MDIGSGRGYPASAISNFPPHPFVFDGVECASMEGLLQAFKFDKPHIQEEVCKLVGKAAKFRGKKRNKAWKGKQTLWWKGQAFDRHGSAYQALLDDAYDALAANTGFQKALLATGDAVLTHSMGRNNASETCLTTREFVSRLTRIRTELQKAQSTK